MTLLKEKTNTYTRNNFVSEPIKQKIKKMDFISSEEQREIDTMNIDWHEKKRYSHKEVFGE